MSDPNLLFQQAATLCTRGDYASGVALYRQVLAMIPGHPQVLSALGNAELAQGNVGEGIDCLRQSLAAYEPQPDVWCNLARGLRQARRFGEALAAADRALALDPGLFEAWNCRGNIAWDMERRDEALQSYNHAAALRPMEPRAHFNRANLLRHLARYDEAVESFTRAVSLDPGYAEAHRNLATLLAELGRYDEALASVDRALALRPDDARAHDARGSILDELLCFEEAVEAFDRAIVLNPSSSAYHCNRGISLHGAQRLDEALADFDRAIALDPANADAIANRGTLLMDLRRLDEASQCCERALAISPGHRAANWNKGFIALMHGDFETGLPLYERRWPTGPLNDYLQTSCPPWRGEDITGKTILVWCEQGFGDYIQFCRYVPLLNARGARVILEVLPRLKSLITRLEGDFVLMGPDARQAKFDLHCPILSLPLNFGTTLADIPADIPYLSAAPEKVALFDAQLGARPRIGFVWSASIHNIRGRARNMLPEFLEPLLDLPFAFHALQKDIQPHDEAWLTERPTVTRHDAEQNDFSDAAALIAAMDLVITVDTSVAHLAGAMGKPVWLMLPYSSDWRWMLDRTDSPWYPTMRLFRQPARGDWASVVEQVRAALLAGGQS